MTDYIHEKQNKCFLFIDSHNSTLVYQYEKLTKGSHPKP